MAVPVPAAVYQERRERFAAERARLAGRSRAFSIARLLVFLAFAACLALVLWNAASPGIWWAGAAVALAVFAVLFALHDRVIREERRFAGLVRINEEALARLARDWDRMPLPPKTTIEGVEGVDGPLARDLNLFGRASLAHLLGNARSPIGETTLARWLLSPAPPAEAALRQGAVAELAPLLDLRQELEVRASGMGSAAQDLKPFLAWAEGEPWLARRRWLVWLARAMAVLTLGLVIAWIARLVPFSVAGVAMLVNFAIANLLAGQMGEVFDRVVARERRFGLYADLFAALEGQAFESDRLRELAGALTLDGVSAHQQMRVLGKRVALAESRHSAPLNFILQVLTVWDVHVLWLLERWQARAGRHARRWLAALAEVEALAGLAGLRFDEPGWVFPELVVDGPIVLAARGLGHPLIRDGVRVGNDVEVGPPGTFLLVTGSNMSGKSTLLRSIGVNVVLAQTGGPVCAAAMRLPPLTLGTSILVEDSLADGVSFFLAELKRIRGVVELAREARAAGRTLLYLLDEVLRGTNTAERQVAVRRVIAHLLREGAIGVVSTHDLELAGIAELAGSVRPVHFRETVSAGGPGPVMTFDYRMRPGVATTTNALKLLDLVGLGERAEASSAPTL